MITVYLHRIGLISAALPDWQTASAVFAALGPESTADSQSESPAESAVGSTPISDSPLPPLKPTLLKPNERRRTTAAIKLALQASQDMFGDSPPPAKLQSVFACAEGDTELTDKICTALSLDGKPVSPTQFHNSVHNAPAGYWAIGHALRNASTSIGAGPGSFASGLLEAAVQADTEQTDVVLIAYDVASPEQLRDCLPNRQAFAVALLLSRQPDKAIAKLDMALTPDAQPSSLSQPALERLRNDSAAAKSLPLLAALAGTQARHVCLPYRTPQTLSVRVTPC